MFCRVFFFFFKQKTAYEMRISDWSSDVCSSDLLTDVEQLLVWAVRSWAFAHQAARSIERDLVRTCGRADAEKAMMAIRAILVLVALYGRRGLRLAPPGWPAVTIDEFRLLQLFAAAQRGMEDRKSTRLNSSHSCASRMPSAA